MHDLSRHPYFEKWTDPVSGVVSFVLSERVAPFQQGFYFTNSSVSKDGEWLWFYAVFPPNRGRTLAVVSLNPDAPVIKHFPQAGFTSASPMVAPEGDAVFFCMGPSVYKMNVEGEVKEICALTKEDISYRQFNAIATHLTMSADGRYFLLDGDMENTWRICLGDVETGEVKLLRKFTSNHNHAQFSPRDPKLFMMAKDNWNDKISGERFPLDHRIWLMDTDLTRFELLCPSDWYGVNCSTTHEWWSKDGLVCWTDYEKGAFECDLETRAITNVWKRTLCHTHCSSDRRYWCADDNPYKWATETVELLFYDRKRGKETPIVAAMPQPPVPEEIFKLDPPYCSRDVYHLDPHPHFSPDDEFVVYTSMVRGTVDVALCPVDQLR